MIDQKQSVKVSMKNVFAIKTKSKRSKARTGVLHLAHGNIKTPFFMPVATNASVKNISPDELKKTGTKCIISNSFILSLKPGTELISSFGSLHDYMDWKAGIFTDSGGFQVLDDFFRQKVSDRGVVFKNPFTGKDVLFTPEDSMQIQAEIGSDVAMALDDVPKHNDDKKYVESTLKRTHAWAMRCYKKHEELRSNGFASDQLLFGIAQGGLFDDLRKKSAIKIAKIPFDGLAIGGLCIGEPKKKTLQALRAQMDGFDEAGREDLPKYFMGLGSPDDIVEAVALGVDIFDSVYPTRNARRGSLFTRKGQIKIKNVKFRSDKDPIEKGCKCYACKNFSRAYISHQFSQSEQLGLRLASIHNIHFMQMLMNDIRAAIDGGTFEEFKEEFLNKYKTPKRNSSEFWQK